MLKLKRQLLFRRIGRDATEAEEDRGDKKRQRRKRKQQQMCSLTRSVIIVERLVQVLGIFYC